MVSRLGFETQDTRIKSLAGRRSPGRLEPVCVHLVRGLTPPHPPRVAEAHSRGWQRGCQPAAAVDRRRPSSRRAQLPKAEHDLGDLMRRAPSLVEAGIQAVNSLSSVVLGRSLRALRNRAGETARARERPNGESVEAASVRIRTIEQVPPPPREKARLRRRPSFLPAWTEGTPPHRESIDGGCADSYRGVT